MPDSHEAVAPDTIEAQAEALLAKVEAGDHAKEEAAAGHREEPVSTPDPSGNGDGSSGPDLSFLEDNLLERWKSDPEGATKDPDFWEEVKKGYLRTADYTKKTQKVAKERETLAAIQEAAQNWEALVSDPDRLQHVLSYKPASKREPEPVEDIPEDLFLRDPKDVLSFIEEKIVQPRVEAARREAEEAKKGIEALTAPQQHAQLCNAVATKWAEELDVPEDEAEAAAKVVLSSFGATENIPVEQLPMLLTMARENVQAKKALEELKTHRASTSDKVDRARAASPRGGVGGTSPAPKSLEARLGRKPTAEEIFDDFLRSRGKTERDLDEGLGLRR